MDEKKHGVDHPIPFKIDSTNYQITANQNPVTGEYLRGLPPVAANYDLWLRGRGSEEDDLITPEKQVTVQPGDHFYTAKSIVKEG